MTTPYGGGWACGQCGCWVSQGTTHICLGGFFPSLSVPPPLGWECPRCRTIYAPFVLSCACKPTATLDPDHHLRGTCYCEDCLPLRRARGTSGEVPAASAPQADGSPTPAHMVDKTDNGTTPKKQEAKG